MLIKLEVLSPEPLVSFSIIIQVWRSIKTALCFASQEQNLTLPHPATESPNKHMNPPVL